jgi:hypothetical protein
MVLAQVCGLPKPRQLAQQFNTGATSLAAQSLSTGARSPRWHNVHRIVARASSLRVPKPASQSGRCPLSQKSHRCHSLVWWWRGSLVWKPCEVILPQGRRSRRRVGIEHADDRLHISRRCHRRQTMQLLAKKAVSTPRYWNPPTPLGPSDYLLSAAQASPGAARAHLAPPSSRRARSSLHPEPRVEANRG